MSHQVLLRHVLHKLSFVFESVRNLQHTIVVGRLPIVVVFARCGGSGSVLYFCDRASPVQPSTAIAGPIFIGMRPCASNSRRGFDCHTNKKNARKGEC